GHETREPGRGDLRRRIHGGVQHEPETVARIEPTPEDRDRDRRLQPGPPRSLPEGGRPRDPALRADRRHGAGKDSETKRGAANLREARWPGLGARAAPASR